MSTLLKSMDDQRAPLLKEQEDLKRDIAQRDQRKKKENEIRQQNVVHFCLPLAREVADLGLIYLANLLSLTHIA